MNFTGKFEYGKNKGNSKNNNKRKSHKNDRRKEKHPSSLLQGIESFSVPVWKGYQNSKFQGQNSRRMKQEHPSPFLHGIESVTVPPWEGSQNSKFQGQNNSFYDNFGFNSWSSTVDRDNEQENYNSSLVAIPSGVTFWSSEVSNEKDKAIGSLKGQIQAYKEILKQQKKESFIFKLHLVYGKMRSAMKIRELLNPFIVEDGIILRATNYLMSNTSFYEYCELAINENLNSTSEQKLDHSQDSFELVKELNVEKLLEDKHLLSSLKEELESTQLDLQNSPLFRNFISKDSTFTPGSKIGQEFILWKDEYFTFQSKSDQILEAMCMSLDRWASSFRELRKNMTDEEIPLFTVEHGEDSLKSFHDEIIHSEKMDIIPDSTLKLLKEIKTRIAKINNVELTVQDAFKSNPDSYNNNLGNGIITNDVKVQEDLYPSLLSFTNQRRILPGLKSSFTRDIFLALSELHKKDVVYIFLSPQNVRVSGGGAILCSADVLSKEEPIPEFKFFSPEVSTNENSECLTSDFSEASCAADYYSLGKMIIWLSGADMQESNLEHEKNVVKEFPFIGKLVACEAKERPSYSDLKNFMDLLTDFYSTFDFNSTSKEEEHALTNMRSTSFKSGCESSSHSLDTNILKEERSLIYKEMEDSDDDDGEDDNE